MAEAIGQARHGGQPLPDSLRAEFEQAMGADFSSVRVHADQRADDVSRSVNAVAFTTGHDLFFSTGGYAPGTHAGQEVLAHELTHVLQQRPQAGPPAGGGHALRPGEGVETPRTGGEQTINITPVPAQLIQRQINSTAHDPYAKSRLKLSLNIKKATQAKKRFPQRFKKGELFTDQEIADIENLSKDQKGKEWLEKAGIGTVQEASEYLRTNRMLIYLAFVLGIGVQEASEYLAPNRRLGSYKNWLKLPLGKRLLIATLAWNRGNGNVENPPPSYTLGHHLAIRSGTLDPQQEAEAKESRDKTIRQAFVNMLTSAPQKQTEKPEWNAQVEHNAQANAIMTKIFFILQAGLQVYQMDDKNKNKGVHVDWEGDVARALAHGGRVNIRIPALLGKDENPYALTDWLGITNQGELPKQGAVKERHFRHTSHSCR